jgi:hypothetical protein
VGQLGSAVRRCGSSAGRCGCSIGRCDGSAGRCGCSIRSVIAQQGGAVEQQGCVVAQLGGVVTQLGGLAVIREVRWLGGGAPYYCLKVPSPSKPAYWWLLPVDGLPARRYLTVGWALGATEEEKSRKGPTVKKSCDNPGIHALLTIFVLRFIEIYN